MKKTSINKLGKIGEINKEAREIIADICWEKDLTSCELRFKGCQGQYNLAPAHKERREDYRGVPELLSAFEHWVVACQHCHEILDNRAKTTKEESDAIFDTLRG